MKEKLSRNSLFTVALLTIFTITNAQKNFKEGLVVLTNGDSLHGKIDYRNWNVNPTKIQFQNGSSINFYKPSDIQYFEVTGFDSYISRIVTKDMRPIDVSQVSSDDRDNDVTDTAFLRILVKGPKLTLYEIVDSKPHFFIQRNGEDKVEELLYKKYLDEIKLSVDEKNIYLKQLTDIAVALQAPVPVFQQIEKSHYNEKDMRSAVRLLNGEEKSAVQSGETKNFKPAKQFLVGAGVQFYTFSFGGDVKRYSGLHFDNGIGPIANVAFDLFSGRVQQRLTFRFELGFSQIKLKGTQTIDEILDYNKEYTYNLTQNSVIPGLGVLYHFVSTNQIRVYAGMGIAYAFSSYPTNTLRTKNLDTGSDVTEDSEIVPEKGWLMATALAGVRINNKINLGLATKLTGAFYSASALGTKYFPLNFTVSYIFSQKQ